MDYLSGLKCSNKRREKSLYEDGGKDWSHAAKEHLELLETGKDKEASSLEPSERACCYLDFILWPRELERLNFCCFKPPSLRYNPRKQMQSS